MHTGMLHLHAILRWIILLVALWAIIKMAAGRSGNKPFTPSDKKPGLFFLICMDLQLLIGLYLYFSSPVWGLATLRNNPFGTVMKDPAMRFFSVEHSVGMLIALILVHVGYSATKKAATDQKKFNKAFWCFLVALIVILVTIPWPFREALGRGWMPH